MPRCPDCNKFRGVELLDPEVNNLDVNEAAITFSVQIVAACEECSTELLQYDFEDVEIEFRPPDHDCNEDFLKVEEENCTAVERQATSGKAYGYELSLKVTCTECGKMWQYDMRDEIPASSMEEV